MTFFKAIKSGSLSGTYLMHGEEEFVKDSALRALKDTLDDVGRELNLQTFDAPLFDASLVNEVISACEMLPFFSERRIVICRSLPVGSEGEKLSEYLPALPQSTLLVFFIRGKAKETLSIVKAIKQRGTIVDFSKCTTQDAIKWVIQQQKRLNVTIPDTAARLIVSLAGTDISTLNNELTKAAGYVGPGNELTKEAISKCVTRSLEVKIFDMQDYFLAGKAQDGLRAYRAMLSDGESPFGIAAFMENRFKAILTARSYIDKGLNRDRVLAITGSSYPAKKAYEAALRYSREEIIANLRRFANVGYLQVSGQQSDAATLEIALIKSMPGKRSLR